ncbi:MAG: ACT domain-containing protein [Melioribacteraceae bacterium]|nr:ACT domain-containing protein [Melioribacteraceae bacterium]RJP62433.1 MAG: ACT domain-containing protein [Ignavibacteriales bacterium]WKZ70401.1 MAG: ACT domain-containing protein [Melioribacteraceae bacterium]
MKLTEDQIRKLTIEAINELGDEATPQKVKAIVSKAAEKLSSESASYTAKSETSEGRVIVTSFGLNEPGIVAAITKALSDAKCDIQDISQKIMEEFFTMIMIVDITHSPRDFKELQEEMKSIAENLKIKIYLQHEDVFRMMHRL